MSVPENVEIAEVVSRVRSWPAAMRVALARRILETLDSPVEEPAPQLPRGPTAAEVVARFKTDKPAPDDATVKQWIDEYRMKKYGK